MTPNIYDFTQHLDQPPLMPLSTCMYCTRVFNTKAHSSSLTSSDRLLTTSSITSYLAWVVGTCVSLGLQCLVPEVLTQGPKLGEQNKG